MRAQEEVMLARKDVVRCGHYARLLHFVKDSGSGVSVNRFAVATCKLQTFHLFKNLEQNGLTLKSQSFILLS